MIKWRDIKGFEGMYQVSNTGLIRSLDRSILKSNGVTQRRVGHIMIQVKNPKGYYIIGLSKNHKRLASTVHKIVASTFLKKGSHTQVNHKDGNKLNNMVSNLEWTNGSGNIKHAYDNGLMAKPTGSKHPLAQIDEEVATTIKSMLNSDINSVDICKLMSISRHIVRDIKRNKTWRHV